jgi:serine/threonine protein kinase
MVNREGQQLGNYKLIRWLGQEVVEVIGEVYFAQDVHYHRRVSVIVASGSFDPQTFSAKTRQLSGLQHPNIVQLQEFGVERNELFYLVFTNPRITSLRTLHAKGSVLSLDTIMPYVKQVAAALQFAHKKGFTNLLVRPENMFVGNKKEIQLGGFESLFANWNDTNQSIGNPSYIAPEFFKDEYLPASDQYALATVVYEWLCGSLPFTFQKQQIQAFRRQILKEPPPPLQEKNAAISATVADVVMKALAKKPDERFESVQAFAEALEKAYQPVVIPDKPVGNERERLTGQLFGNYRLLRVVGQGSSGIVYLGEHVDLKLQAAIKILSPECDTDEFENGIQRIAKLAHAHILPIRNFGHKDKTLFLEMEYAPNGTLLQRHPKGTSIPLLTAVGYVKQIAEALQYAHDRNVVHGRLSPNEMLLSKDGEILLSGFDPLIEEQSAVQHAQTAGVYSPPELSKGKMRPASDQYRLAAIVYEWLSGKRPLPTSVTAHDNATPAPLSLYVPQLPAAVEEAIMKALHKEPKQRFKSIQDFADALEQSVAPLESNQDQGKLVGQRFGDYILKSWVGEGGFGKVYRGEHHSLGTLAAVKVLQLDRRITEKDKKQFRNEAQALAKLAHPRIVRIQDYGLQNDTPYLVMDYYAGGSLRKLHPRGSRLPLAIVLNYIRQIAEALQYAHDHKLVHRDVKPENVLIGSKGELVLSDFGLVITAHDTLSREEQDKLGTAPYMAPEHFDGKAVPASDQYSLAIVTYELIRGSRPFEGDLLQLAYQATYQAPPPLQANVTQITPFVEQVIFKALEKNPKNRYPSVTEYVKAFEKAIDEW